MATKKRKATLQEKSPTITIAPSDERLVALNRDHHVRMHRDSSSRTTNSAANVCNKDADSRTDIINAMIGSASRFGITSSGGDVLELGAGRGGDRTTLESKLGASYVGIEVVPEIAEISGSVCCSIETLPAEWSGRFKWVYSRHVMEHVIDCDAAIANLARVTTDDAIIGAVTPHYFPDPEPAHITQLRVAEWVDAYRRHGFVATYATTLTHNCLEAHIVVVKRSVLEKKLSDTSISEQERTVIKNILG